MEGLCIRIYMSESDSINGQPALPTIVALCQEAGLRGVSVMRGIEGLGSHGIHSASFVALAHRLPLVVEAIDQKETVEKALRFLAIQIQPFLVATWPVKISFADQTSAGAE